MGFGGGTFHGQMRKFAGSGATILALAGLALVGLVMATGPVRAQDQAPAAENLRPLPEPKILKLEQVGSVARIRGVVEADDINGEVRVLRLGHPIFRGDRLITGPGTRLQIALKDGTTFTLGETSRISIDDYVFDEAENTGGALFRLTKGVFRMATGAIAELAGEPLRVRTPVATIGIRGTEFWGLQSAEQLQLVLLSGAAVYAENAAGRTEVTEPGFVTVVTGPDVAPTPSVRLPPDLLAEAAETVSF